MKSRRHIIISPDTVPDGAPCMPRLAPGQDLITVFTDEILMQHISARTRKGSVFYTDTFRGYQSLKRYGKYHVVNHNKQLVDKRTKNHINGIEGFWSHAKHILYNYRDSVQDVWVWTPSYRIWIRLAAVTRVSVSRRSGIATAWCAEPEERCQEMNNYDCQRSHLRDPRQLTTWVRDCKYLKRYDEITNSPCTL